MELIDHAQEYIAALGRLEDADDKRKHYEQLHEAAQYDVADAESKMKALLGDDEKQYLTFGATILEVTATKVTVIKAIAAQVEERRALVATAIVAETQSMEPMEPIDKGAEKAEALRRIKGEGRTQRFEAPTPIEAPGEPTADGATVVRGPVSRPEPERLPPGIRTYLPPSARGKPGRR